MNAKKLEDSFMILLSGSLILIGVALFTQFVLGWYPCPMCFWQREPHYVLFAIFLLTLVGSALGSIKQYLFGAALIIGVICYLVAIYRAGFHVGVENLWWKGWEACGSGGGGSSMTAADLLGTPTKDCTVPTYIFPGISMALGHFMVLSLILIVSLANLLRGK